MNPKDFSNLRTGDVLRDAHGRNFTIIHTADIGVVAQHTIGIPASECERWTHAAGVVRTEAVPAPVPVKLPRPSANVIRGDLIRAGYRFVEDKKGARLITPDGGGECTDICKEWDRIVDDILKQSRVSTAPLGTPGSIRLRDARLTLVKAGWRMNIGGGAVWTSPAGRSVPGTYSALAALTGAETPDRKSADLLNAGWSQDTDGCWLSPNGARIGGTSYAWGQLKGL